MLKIIASLFFVLVLLIVTESLFRKRKFGTEISRKIIHIVVASFVASWPYFMTYREIFFISLAFFVVILISRVFHIFDSIHSVSRKTLGELFFPLGIALLALFAPDKIIFLIAMLNVGLADGLAAVVGRKFGKNNTYTMFTQTKSVAGTITFATISFLILLACKIVVPHEAHFIAVYQLILVPILLALTESFGVYGSDDLMVPFMTIVALVWL